MPKLAMPNSTLLWFRSDLRVRDNALMQIAEKADNVCCVYCVDPRQMESNDSHAQINSESLREAGCAPIGKQGPYRARFLVESLVCLRKNLEILGTRLMIFKGKPEEIVPRIATNSNWTVAFSGNFWAEEKEIEDVLLSRLSKNNVEYQCVPWTNALHHPDDLKNMANIDINDLPQPFTRYRQQLEKCGVPVRPNIQLPQQEAPPKPAPCKCCEHCGQLLPEYRADKTQEQIAGIEREAAKSVKPMRTAEGEPDVSEVASESEGRERSLAKSDDGKKNVEEKLAQLLALDPWSDLMGPPDLNYPLHDKSLPSPPDDLDDILQNDPLLRHSLVDCDDVLEAVMGLAPGAPLMDSRRVFDFKGGEQEALRRLESFCLKGLDTYKATRNLLVGASNSSKFSPFLSIGCLSPRQVYWRVKLHEDKNDGRTNHTYWIVFELMWRDWFRYLCQKHGSKVFEAGGPAGKEQEWNYSIPHYDAWRTGQTGVPFIDANMRELRETGWMSNRGRQNVASFLIHDLKLDWRLGAMHFQEYLIDHDICSNFGNWAHCAGLTTAKQRIAQFNVVGQGASYDKGAEYIRTWLPELKKVPDDYIHAPWTMPSELQNGLDSSFGRKRDRTFKLGRDYPNTVVPAVEDWNGTPTLMRSQAKRTKSGRSRVGKSKTKSRNRKSSSPRKQRTPRNKEPRIPGSRIKDGASVPGPAGPSGQRSPGSQRTPTPVRRQHRELRLPHSQSGDMLETVRRQQRNWESEGMLEAVRRQHRASESGDMLQQFLEAPNSHSHNNNGPSPRPRWNRSVSERSDRSMSRSMASPSHSMASPSNGIPQHGVPQPYMSNINYPRSDRAASRTPRNQFPGGFPAYCPYPTFNPHPSAHSPGGPAPHPQMD